MSDTAKPDVELVAQPERPWLMWAFAAAIVLLTCSAYWGGLDNGFTNWDDNWLITENRHIRGLGWDNLQAMFNPMAPREELGNEYLPLRDLSYAVNYAFDGLSPKGYHATNLLLHIFNSLLVMLFAARLTGRRWIGGAAGLLFAIHPVHVEAVSWLSSRKDLLSTFFMMLSANLYLSARRSRAGLMSSQSFVQRVRESTRLSYIFAVLFFVCALLSKMTAVVLPALLLLVELFRGHALHAMPRAKRALAQAPFWAIAVLFTALASHIGSGLMREPYGENKFQSVLTATSAITRDFQVLFIGWPMHAAVDLPVQTGLSLPVILGLLILIALVAVGLIGLREGKAGWSSRKAMAWGMGGFCALWFLVALSPVSNFFVQIGTVFAERYLYIPSIGFCIGLASLGALGLEHARRRESLHKALLPMVVLLSLAVSVLGIWGTMEATSPWAGSTALWKHTLKLDPENNVAHFNLAREYEEEALTGGADDEQREALLQSAYEHYQLALDNPARTYRHDPARLYAAMALNQVYRGKPERGLELLDEASRHVELPWRDERARNDIEALIANPRGLALSALGRHEEAVAAFEEALAKSDRYKGAHINLCSELTRQALKQDPIDETMLNRAKSHLADYERAKGRDALYVEARARTLLAEFDRRLALSGKGGQKDIPKELQPLLDEARELYRELIELRDNGATPPAAMAGTLVEAADAFGRGRLGDDTAEKYLRRAFQLRPSYLGLRYLLAQLLFEKANELQQKGKEAAPIRAEATKLLAEELNLHPDYLPAKALKAAGLRQNAANQAGALMAGWRREYAAIRKDDSPTWEGLIVTLYKREEFRKELTVAVTLMRQAIETDPTNEEGHSMVEGSFLEIAMGMWFTRDNDLRALAEELLRTAFNARPIDGEIGDKLTAFYMELAEELIRKPSDDLPESERRVEMDNLLKNMLTLSDRARNILSRKLFNVGLNVESGKTKLRDERGEPMALSEPARRMAASEFIRAATILNPDNVEALDWLKKYYEDEGNFEEALKVFTQLIEALQDRPELIHGVYLSLGQLQLDFGQQLLVAYKGKIKLGKDEEAAALRNKAVQAYLDALTTTSKLIDNPENPEALNLPIRMRGMAAQRLAYLVIGKAYEYYSIALDAYALAPLDFEVEIAEVRQKRAWFEEDAYARLRELKEMLKNAEDYGRDPGDLRADIIDVERRIARTEAELLLKEGKLAKALERVEQAFGDALLLPSPDLLAARGDIYMAMSREQADKDKREAFVVKAAKDYVRAVLVPDALIKGADLYWKDEAMRFEADGRIRARLAYAKAEEVITTALVTMDEQSPEQIRYEKLLEHARNELGQMRDLAIRYQAGARLQHEAGKLHEALEFINDALELVGDHVENYQRKAKILRDLATAEPEHAKDYANEARDALNSALRMRHLLTSQRLSLMLDLGNLLVDLLDDSKAAREWATRTRDLMGTEIGPGFTAESHALYKSRLAELDAKLK